MLKTSQEASVLRLNRIEANCPDNGCFWDDEEEVPGRRDEFRWADALLLIRRAVHLAVAPLNQIAMRPETSQRTPLADSGRPATA